MNQCDCSCDIFQVFFNPFSAHIWRICPALQSFQPNRFHILTSGTQIYGYNENWNNLGGHNYLIENKYSRTLKKIQNLTKKSSAPSIQKYLNSPFKNWNNAAEIKFWHLWYNSNLLITISLQSDEVKLWYIKLSKLDLTEVIVWNIKV